MKTAIFLALPWLLLLLVDRLSSRRSSDRARQDRVFGLVVASRFLVVIVPFVLFASIWTVTSVASAIGISLSPSTCVTLAGIPTVVTALNGIRRYRRRFPKSSNRH
jgi:hypothetical protein